MFGIGLRDHFTNTSISDTSVLIIPVSIMFTITRTTTDLILPDLHFEDELIPWLRLSGRTAAVPFVANMISGRPEIIYVNGLVPDLPLDCLLGTTEPHRASNFDAFMRPRRVTEQLAANTTWIRPRKRSVVHICQIPISTNKLERSS